MIVFAKYSAVFYGKSQVQAGCQLNSSLYIYKYMYIFIEQLEVGARVYRKVLTSFEDCCHIQLRWRSDSQGRANTQPLD